MAPISLDRANFFALVLELLFYGAFSVLFVAALWVITVQRSVINYRLLITLLTIWAISTTHLILDIVRATKAYVDLQDGTPLAYYGNLSNPLQAGKTAVYVLLTMVGDGFAIYRCYAVWGQRWIVAVIPTMLLCGTGIGGFGATVAFSRAAPGAAVFLPAIVPWVTSFILMTLCTNVVCTLLIAWRINRVQRELRSVNVSGSVTGSALIVIVESAAIYSSATIALMITYWLGNNAQYMVLDMTSPLIGITFTAIILRVSLGISSRDMTSVSFPQGRSLNSNVRSMDRERMKRMTVKVSQLVEVESGRPQEEEDDSTHKSESV